MKDEGRMRNDEFRAKQRPTTKRQGPRASELPHSSFLVPRSRSGISLLEVLISVFILTVGLLGVASLIPIGKLAMIETNKSDRTGACGRAALHEIRIRRMVDMSINTTTPANTNLVDSLYPVGDASWPGRVDDCAANRLPFAIDPLGVANDLYGGPPAALGMNLGGTRELTLTPTNFSDYFPLPRFSLNWAWATPLLADQVFRWGDELSFDLPSDATLRPRAYARDDQARIVPYPVLPSDPILTPAATTWTPLSANTGNFSWFATVNPMGNDSYSVSVVVCYQRVFSTTTPGVPATNQPTAERTVDVVNIVGGTVQLAQNTTDVTGLTPVPLNSSTFPLTKNQWVMLLGWETVTGERVPRVCKWYRVVGIGTDVATTPYLSLDGPDWDGNRFSGANAGTTMVVVDGVTGVYTTTVKLGQ